MEHLPEMPRRRQQQQQRHQPGIRHVSQVRGPQGHRATADFTALGAPARRPMSRGSFGSDSSRPSTAQQMAELQAPRTAAERLLRGYLLDRVADPVLFAERFAPPVAGRYAGKGPGLVKQYYGADGSTCVRRPLTALDHAKTRRELRALEVAATGAFANGGDAEDPSDLLSHGSTSLDSQIFGLSAYEAFMMKRNDQTVSARQRLHMNRKKDEKRQLNGHAIVVHKKMLRKIRAQAVEARAQAEREGRDASAPKPLVALEVRAENISTAIGKMEATFREAEARDLKRRTKAAKRIQRFLRGAVVRATHLGVNLKARCLLDFFKAERDDDDDDELASYNFKPELYDPLASIIQRSYRRYRAEAIRVNWICLRLAARWRAKYKLKKRRERLEKLRLARLAAGKG